MSAAIEILYVGADDEFAANVVDVLEEDWDGCRIDLTVLQTQDEGVERVRDDCIDCVVSEYELPEGEGVDLLGTVRGIWPNLPFILAPVDGSETVAARAVAEDVTHYVPRRSNGTDADRLADRIEMAVNESPVSPVPSIGPEQYRLLVEQNLVGIGIVQDERFRYVNPKFAEIHGYRQVELIGESVLELIAEEDVERARRNLQRRRSGEDPHDRYVITAQTKDGTAIEVELQSRRLEYEGDPAVMGVVRDVSERRERQRELGRYEAFVEHSGDAIAVVGMDGRIEFLSEGGKTEAGYDPDELIGEQVYEYVHPEDREKLADRLASIIDYPETSVTAEYRFRRPDGGWAWIESRVVNRLDDPAIDGILMNTRNVDERKAREASLERYETVVDHLREAVWMLDEDGRIEFINEYLADVLDVSESAITGEPIAEVLVDADVSFDSRENGEARTVVKRLFPDAPGGEVRDVVRLFIDGERVVLDIKNVLLEGPDGNHVIGAARNVTEREALQTRLRVYERAIEGSTDLFAAIDRNREYIFANQAYCEYHGVDPEWVVGRSVDEVLDEALIDRIDEYIERSFAGEEVHYDVTRIHPDLGDRHLDVRYYPVTTPDSESHILVAAMRDVTERKRREQRVTALHEAATDIAAADLETEVYRALVNAAIDVLEFDFAIADAERDGVLVPQAMTENLSQGGYYEETSLEDDNTLAARAYNQDDTILTNDLREQDVAPADSEYRSILTVPIGGFGAFQAGSREVDAFDETDRALTEILVGHAVEALTRLEQRQELQARREALERENERLDRFASVVSHDLRNPLTVANGQLELARESCESPRLDEIETSLTRMEAMIQDLLAMAREGQIVDDGELSPVDLDAIARAAWKQVSTSKAELVAESGLDAVADSDRVKHVFANLFRNSIEHGFPDNPPGAEDGSAGLTVRVGALSDEDETGFFVEDDGIGIPESDREPVFDPGYSTDPEGTGFGLMIVKDVVNAHGWTIRLTQSEDGGARFEISDVEIA
ncbi:MAG: PAS domain S-box-containing protein [Natrialbaceae archaeon]|jgi:PAS domain S-box-containing protein